MAKLIKEELRVRFNESVNEFYMDDDGIGILNSYSILSVLDFREHTWKEGNARVSAIPNIIFEYTLKHYSNRNILQKYLWFVNALMRSAMGDVIIEAEEVKQKIVECIQNT